MKTLVLVQTAATSCPAVRTSHRLAVPGTGWLGRRRWLRVSVLGLLLVAVLLASAAQAQRPFFQLYLKPATGPSDTTYVYFEAGATTGFDANYDASKLPNSSGLNLASFTQMGQQLAINGLPPSLLAAPYTLNLFVGAPQYGVYTLQVRKQRAFGSTQLFLTDALLGSSTPLDSGSVYSFDLTAANTNSTAATSTRFALLFQPGPDPLPVTLTAFTAQAQPPGVALAWLTASEQRSAYFAVERSADGQSFTEIGRVAAAGTSSQTHRYAFFDLLPLGGTGYYRLRQVDLDGSFQYSPVRVVGGHAAAALRVFPNPARAGSALRGAAPGAAVQVFDAVGRAVATAPADATGTFVLPLGLPGGLYLVRSGPACTRLVVE